MGFPSGSMVKKAPGQAGDPDSISGLGKALEKEMATHSWEIPLTEI